MMDVQRVPVADEHLDAERDFLLGQLAELVVAYNRDAEPIRRLLAENEARRQYRYFLTEQNGTET